jgi:hypothetical protein
VVTRLGRQVQALRPSPEIQRHYRSFRAISALIDEYIALGVKGRQPPNGQRPRYVRQPELALCGDVAAAATAWRRERAAAIRHRIINEPHAFADFGCAF